MNAERPLIAMEAEHGVLGALMKKPELCETVGAFLSAADFSSEDNGALYVMILACHSKKLTPDPLTLAEIRAELPSGDATMVYANELWHKISSAANADHYGKIIVERAKARRLYEIGSRLMELAGSAGSLVQQFAEAQSLVMALDAEDETPDVITMSKALMPVFDQMQDRNDGKKVVGLEFGLPDLDRIVQMARPGNLIIIGGRPGTGKTVLGTGFADHVAISRGAASLIFSLEMPHTELAKRSLSALSGVSQNHIDSGSAIQNEESILKLTAATSRLSNADIRICDKGGLTFARICSIARFQHRAQPLACIVIDYLSLIATDPNGRYQNRNLELGSYTRGFKALAKELGLPVVLLCQLNRGIETRSDPKPKMSDLRDSGEIEQDADVIILAHRDMESERGRSGLTEIDVVKCRHARPDFCVLQFQGEYARFVSAAPQAYATPEPEPTRTVRKSARDFIRGRENA